MTDSSSSTRIADYYTQLGATQGTAGPIGELTAYLAGAEYTLEVLHALYERHEESSERWFLGQRIDLLLGYVRHCLILDRVLIPEHVQDIRTLHALLRIPNDAYARLRPAEVAAILREQLDEILSDAVIDESEDLYQTQLQAIFGLGYDEYFSMTRVIFERVWTDLYSEAARGNQHPSNPIFLLRWLRWNRLSELHSRNGEHWAHSIRSHARAESDRGPLFTSHNASISATREKTIASAQSTHDG